METLFFKDEGFTPMRNKLTTTRSVTLWLDGRAETF